MPSLALVVVRLGRYEPPPTPDGVIDTSLFADIPQGGIFPGRGMVPPETWDDHGFLTPILDSIAPRTRRTGLWNSRLGIRAWAGLTEGDAQYTI